MNLGAAVMQTKPNCPQSIVGWQKIIDIQKYLGSLIRERDWNENERSCNPTIVLQDFAMYDSYHKGFSSIVTASKAHDEIINDNHSNWLTADEQNRVIHSQQSTTVVYTENRLYVLP
jgi:hypothetical protein